MGEVQKKCEALRDIRVEIDSVLATLKTLFHDAREISNDLLSCEVRNQSALVEELHDAGGPTRKRKKAVSLSDTDLHLPSEPEELTKRKPKKDVSKPDPVRGPGKRACSVCRETGHRATTCFKRK